MSAFDNLIDHIVAENTEYPALRTVIEKEILYHDILRVMSEMEFLKSLTFMREHAFRNSCATSLLRLPDDQIVICGIFIGFRRKT